MEMTAKKKAAKKKRAIETGGPGPGIMAKLKAVKRKTAKKKTAKKKTAKK